MIKEAVMNKNTKVSDKHFDVIINDFLKDYLANFHSFLSSQGMVEKDPTLDLAIDKISQAMTALNQRSRDRLKKGIYGKSI